MPPWGTVLDAATVDRLVAYVSWLAARDGAAAGATLTPFSLDDAERIAAGRKRFNKTCAGYCHGHDGVGGRAPDFRGRSELTAQFLYDTIYHGREGADVMPPWGDALSEERIWELVAFLRHLGALPAD
ncbi:MAG: cytochrome c [Rhodocyclaceae bacterium]|nr:cytochrome c [Rhodocyclaceae bacterium]